MSSCATAYSKLKAQIQRTNGLGRSSVYTSLSVCINVNTFVGVCGLCAPSQTWAHDYIYVTQTLADMQVQKPGLQFLQISKEFHLHVKTLHSLASFCASMCSLIIFRDEILKMGDNTSQCKCISFVWSYRRLKKKSAFENMNVLVSKAEICCRWNCPIYGRIPLFLPADTDHKMHSKYHKIT